MAKVKILTCLLLLWSCSRTEPSKKELVDAAREFAKTDCECADATLKVFVVNGQSVVYKCSNGTDGEARLTDPFILECKK